MNMLELQVLVAVSGVPESLAGPSLLDAPGLAIELHPALSAPASAKPDRQARPERALGSPRVDRVKNKSDRGPTHV